MSENSNGRGPLFPWSEPPTAAAYAVGDTVYSGDTAGRVVSVDPGEASMGIVWSDGDGGAITYPMDATFLRKAMPWE